MQISTLGIDLAKNIFVLHSVDHSGKTVLRKKLNRSQFVPFVIQLPPCLIGMEACSSSHHFARIFIREGHEVRMMPPQYVKPYVKTNKTDAADAEAICEAVTRPNMRFVHVKTIDQQAVIALHTERDLYMRQRTATSNCRRAMLSELGFCIPTGMSALYKSVPAILEDAENELPSFVRRSISRRLEELQAKEEQIAQAEQDLQSWFQTQPDCQRVAKVPGIGLLTATYLIASVGNCKQFNSAKQFAAWLGLTPREHSSGGKQRFGGISKRGDGYFRYLLVHGARSVLKLIERYKESMPWLYALSQRKHHNVAAVAQATKTARVLWAMLTKGSEYKISLAT
ncbi:IS110 family transposase [Citrobacter sp. NCU1]|uniref:IS110 family transposase n=1 Tax=Citrobacter sp. NCU1 TaxID=2026683 RepID=UPI00139152BC|nr:IS110 family transposase [Citrobacter sp. NCU1]NDO79650.1 IS110 family transposase [Citrobacter sp. NCU1]